MMSLAGSRTVLPAFLLASSASLYRLRCQKVMTTEVQMGSEAQHSLISSMSRPLSSSSRKVPAEKKSARAAVAQLQLAHCTFISCNTSATMASPSCARSSSGLCQSSMASPLTSTSPSTMAPMKVRRRVSQATCTNVSASCSPDRPLVLSAVRTFQSSATPPAGQMGRSHRPSSEWQGMRCGGLTTTITWPRRPPAVPSSTRPPVPRTKSTSPGATAPSRPASPHGSLYSRRKAAPRRGMPPARGARGARGGTWRWGQAGLRGRGLGRGGRQGVRRHPGALGRRPQDLGARPAEHGRPRRADGRAGG
mmetsp:Transcript_111263/g.359175  ORF Transcript_111263/g.359175 Transcript_111263/m.359175 type:complete len:307 (-) Transcript_111263:171-1091(-)